MVIIVQLELKDFKTYAGRNVLPFRGKFTVVSGPNGSGKSNLVDAVAFVMGAKLSDLRVARMAELCHPSNPERDDRGKSRTFVKVILRSNDGNEQCFQRSIIHSQCKYSINDNEVTSLDYTEALKKFNINGKVNNFLVFQDSIESIITKKASDRTLIFEELSGSIGSKAEYDRLKETVQKYVNENQNLLNVKRSLTKEIKDMQLRRMESKKFQELFNQNQLAKGNLLLFDLHYIRKTMQSLISEEHKLKDVIKVCDSRKSNVEDQLVQLKEDCAKISQLCENRENACKPKELELKQLTEDLVELRAKREYFEKRIDLCRRNYESAKSAETARKSTIHDLEDALNRVQLTKEKYVQQYIGTSGRNMELTESEIEKYTNLKNAASAACSRNNDRLADLERKHKHLEDLYNYENTKLAETESAFQLGQMRKTAVTERIVKLQEFVEKKGNDLNEKRTAYQRITSVLPSFERQVERLRRDIEKINEEIGDIKEDKYDSARKTLETVEALKAEIPGVYGHLGGLCRTIHNRYNVAVTKVLGANVDAIVVDYVKTARKCIEYLRNKKIGAYTFLPLDQLQETNLSPNLRAIEDPPNVKLVYDVISFSRPEISKAVFYATGNTLVAEIQSDAAKLAYETAKGQNCVSLDGCMYMKSGLISGGNYDLVRKAKRWDAQRKRNLKDEKEELTARLKKILREAPKHSEVTFLATTINSIEKYSQYSKQDLDEAYKELNQIENELKSLEAIKATMKENVMEAKRNMDKAFEAMRDLRSENETKETQIFAKFCKQNNIDSIHVYEDGKRLYEEKLREFDQQIDRAKNLLSYEQSKDTKKNIQRWKAKFEEAETELEPIVGLENETKLLIEKATAELKTLQLKHQESLSRFNEMKEKISLVRNELTKISKEKISLGKNLNKLQQRIGEERAKVHSLLVEAKMNGLSVVENNPTASSGTSDGSSSDFTETSRSLTSELEATNLNIDSSKLAENLRDLDGAGIEKSRQSLEREIIAQQAEMDRLSSGANMPKSQQYALLQERLKETNEMLETNRTILNTASAEFNFVKIDRLNKFNAFFENVSKRVDVIYKQLMRNPTAAAYLLPENPEEPYLAGIQYSCIVPGKSFQVNDNLSGGEKTMTALPLLFAMQSANEAEPPFTILDEVDAALDHSNTMKVVNYLKRNDRNQKIFITHKNEILVEADTLIGITSRGEGSQMESVIFSMDLSRYRNGTRA